MATGVEPAISNSIVCVIFYVKTFENIVHYINHIKTQVYIIRLTLP